MVPTAARRAKPVQRNYPQGLQGNPDACRPRRGSACNVSEHGAPAEAQRSGFGGESFPAKRRQWRIKRAGKKERRDWRASLARESQCRDGSKGTVEGVSFAACGEANDLKLVPTKRAAMHGWFCPVRTAHRRHGPLFFGGAGGTPRPFLSPAFFGKESGAPAESEAPGALPIKIQRSHLPKSGPSPGGIPADGWRAGVVAPHGLVDTRASGRPQVAPTSSAQVTDHSLRRKRQSSFPPLCLLSPRRPLRWVAAGAPWNRHSSCHVPAGGAAGMPRPTGS